MASPFPSPGRPLAGLLLACLLLHGLPAAAGDGLTLCFERKDGKPWRTINGEGLNFELLRQVSARLQLEFHYVALPWKRCLAKLQANEVDGVFSVSFSPARLQAGAYPGGAVPDPGKRMHNSRYFLVRRKGSLIDWDGKAFQHADGAIGYNLGYSVGEFLHAQRVTVEEVNQRPADLLKLVSMGRIAGAAVFESDMEAVNQSEFGAQLEIRPVPLLEKPYYLLLSHAFVARQPQLAQQIWKTVEDVRMGAAYTKLYRAAGALPDN